jgi:hypothetical protein
VNSVQNGVDVDVILRSRAMIVPGRQGNIANRFAVLVTCDVCDYLLPTATTMMSTAMTMT